MIRSIPAALLFLGLVTMATPSAVACPFCFGAQQLTLRERIEAPDASVLVEWRSGEPGNLDDETPPSTTFRVRKVWKGELSVDETFATDHYYAGEPGDRFLLVGNRLEDVLRWDRAIPLTEAAIAYLADLPPSTAPVTERMRHAFAHLENEDTTIANDAFDVLAASKYEDIAAAREHLDAQALRRWVHDPDTLVMRLGVYGMLLGLAGNEDDIPRLHERIFVADADRPIRIGIDGVMGGYLLLTGSRGLDQLDAAYLAAADVSPDNLSAVTSALRFMWEYGDGLISKERLRRSMRLALDHEETLELAIVDLARWQDWSVTERLIALFHTNDAHRGLQRRIVGYLTVAAGAASDDLSPADQTAVEQAAAALESIRQSDPILYRNAQRGLIQR